MLVRVGRGCINGICGGMKRFLVYGVFMMVFKDCEVIWVKIVLCVVDFCV